MGGEEETEMGEEMSNDDGANTVPLLTPHKMGRFDLSHR